MCVDFCNSAKLSPHSQIFPLICRFRPKTLSSPSRGGAIVSPACVCRPRGVVNSDGGNVGMPDGKLPPPLPPPPTFVPTRSSLLLPRGLPVNGLMSPPPPPLGPEHEDVLIMSAAPPPTVVVFIPLMVGDRALAAVVNRDAVRCIVIIAFDALRHL